MRLLEGRVSSTRQPKPGYMVHYALNSDPHRGQERPAVVVRVEEGGLVTLDVFILVGDQEEDAFPTAVMQTVPVRYSLGKEPGTWHWIED